MITEIDGQKYQQTPIDGCPDQYRLTRLEHEYAQLDAELPRSGNPLAAAFAIIVAIIVFVIAAMTAIALFPLMRY